VQNVQFLARRGWEDMPIILAGDYKVNVKDNYNAELVVFMKDTFEVALHYYQAVCKHPCRLSKQVEAGLHGCGEFHFLEKRSSTFFSLGSVPSRKCEYRSFPGVSDVSLTAEAHLYVGLASVY
jgi:hypothetical protein